MAKICERRYADFGDPFVVKARLSTGSNGTAYSTLGCYSSDIGRLMLRHSTNAGAGGSLSMGCPTTDVGNIANIYGILMGFDSDSSNLNGVQYIGPGSTQNIYVERFDFGKEYAINFSTLNSTVLPGSSDIGSLVGFATTQFAAPATALNAALPSNMKLCMTNAGSTVAPGLTGSTNGSKCFRITGYDTNRRKLFVIPVKDSSSFSW
jgi:hypothetical protein